MPNQKSVYGHVSQKPADVRRNYGTTGRFLMILVVFYCVGCGSTDYTFAPVTGRITLDGEPVPNARITFEPLADEEGGRPGPWSVAAADENGHFTMNTAGGPAGAVVGSHRERISTRVESEDGTSDLVPEAIPAKYNENSELMFEVEEGGDDKVHFDLQSTTGSNN